MPPLLKFSQKKEKARGPALEKRSRCAPLSSVAPPTAERGNRQYRFEGPSPTKGETR